MMYGGEKSDSAIVVMNPANDAALAAEEWAERRAGTNGNPRERPAGQTQRWAPRVVDRIGYGNPQVAVNYRR